MNPKPTTDDVDKMLKTVETMHGVGAMPVRDFCKCLVSLGYEYILMGATETGLGLLLRVNTLEPEYYPRFQLEDMEADELYKEVVVRLAYRLVQLGIVAGGDEVHAPTQPRGRC